MRQLKQVLAVLLIVVMLMPSVAFANTNSTAQTERLTQENGVRIIEGAEKDAILEKLDRNHHDSDEDFDVVEEPEEVRVLIELHEEPVIEVATESGVAVKELDDASYANALSNVVSEQQSVDRQLKNLGLEEVDAFQVVINGITGNVPSRNVSKIEQLPAVKNVYYINEYERPEPINPSMSASVDLVDAPAAWNISQFKGEGSVIAVIDSGVDTSHKDWNITDPSKVALTEEDVNNLKVQHQNETDANGKILLPGVYVNEKIPYAYDYYDRDTNTYETGASSHGMHVAGTIAANGEIKGVAPEAQILAMKVFSSDTDLSTVFSDIYIRAMEDSIILGADAVNLSLGSPAGIYRRDGQSAEDAAIDNLLENGVVTVIANGNDSTMTDGWGMNMLTTNPDIGTSGAPAINNNTLSVASFNNSAFQTTTLDTSVGRFAMNFHAGSPRSEEQFNVTFAGLGGPDDFTDFPQGNAALIMRGDYNFSVKIQNAMDAGAGAVILYNHASGGDELMGLDLGGLVPKIPVTFIGHSGGEVMRAALENKGVTAALDFTPSTVQSPFASEISGFSSWGPSSDLRMKPEIAAPGGDINSTQNDDTYGYMSGTSMATPHVAGAVGVVHQALREKYAITGGQAAKLSKIILMNTAIPASHPTEGYPYSVMEQGAGYMNVYNATRTPVYVTATGTNDNVSDAKLEIKDNINGTFDYELQLTNISDYAVTYTLGANAQTPDTSAITESPSVYTQTSRELGVNHTSEGQSVTVRPSETVTVSGTVSVPDAPADQFLNGFITLTNETTKGLDLSVPYLGYNGDWGEPPMFDEHAYLGRSFFGWTQVMGIAPNGGFNFLNLQEEPMDEEYFNYAGPNRLPVMVYSLLRNAENIVHTVQDADGNVLRTLNNEILIRKINRLYAGANPYRMNDWNAWDGKIRGREVESGTLYYLSAEGQLNYDAPKQEIRFPVAWDNVAPEASAEYDAETQTLNVTFGDEHAGTWYVDFYDEGFANFLEAESFAVSVPNDDGWGSIWERNHEEGDTVSVDLSNVDSKVVNLVVVDRVGNETLLEVTLAEDVASEPQITITEPGLLTAHSGESILVSGRITGTEVVDRVIVELIDDATGEVVGEPVEAVVTEDANGNFIYTVEEFPLDVAQGMQILRVTAYSGDFENSVSQYIIVDREDPTLTLEAVAVTSNATEPIVITATDNYWAITLEEIDEFGNVTNHIAYYESLGYPNFYEKYTEYTTTINVPLEIGENHFYIRMTDVAGNVVEESITIIRNEDAPVDKSLLEAKLAEAQALNPEDYVQGYEALEEAMEAAQAALDNPDATQTEVSEALADLIEAMNNLVEPVSRAVDKAALIRRVNDAQQLDLEGYTDESVANLVAAIEAAKEVIDNRDATQEEVDAALLALNNAIHNLEEITDQPVVDKTALEAKVQEAEAIDTNLYAEGVEDFVAALQDAKDVLADQDATQAEVDAALQALINAMNALVLAEEEPVDKSELEALLDEAMDLNLNNYEGGVNELVQSILDAERVINNPDATQEEVDAAAEALRDAMDNLVVSKPDPVRPVDPNPGPVDPVRPGPIPGVEDPERPTDPSDKPEVETIAGKDRVLTSVEISKANFKEADTVVLTNANVNAFADALVAGSYANLNDAPILLSGTDTLHPEVLKEMKRLGADRIVLIGGTLRLSEDLVELLEKEGFSVERIAGATRYDTALQVAEEVMKENPDARPILATGERFPDALAANTIAAPEKAPILLTPTAELYDGVSKFFDKHDVNSLIVLGGSVAISDDLMDELQGMNITRLAGETRYETALLIAKYQYKTPVHVYLATGRLAADALSAGAILAENEGAILLVDYDTILPEVKDYMDDAETITILGGQLAIKVDLKY